MSKTTIEWTNETWNPTTGCKMVSAGCTNCYAEKMTKRLAGMGQAKYQGILTEKGRFNGKVRTHEDELGRPYTWRKPKKVFVNSMSDLFHEDVPFVFIDKVFAVMSSTQQHTYQILTKRPERMAEYFNSGRVAVELQRKYWRNGYVPNVWLGTSVENQEAANERIPHLLKCPAAVRFLSCEPLLGEVNLMCISHDDFLQTNALGDEHNGVFRRVNWVIAGGESGPDARPMHPDWARKLRNQCAHAGVPFFFKQWGEYKPYDGFPIPLGDMGKIKFYTEDGKLTAVTRSSPASVLNKFPIAAKLGKHKSGRELDGMEHNEFPKQTKP